MLRTLMCAFAIAFGFGATTVSAQSLGDILKGIVVQELQDKLGAEENDIQPPKAQPEHQEQPSGLTIILDGNGQVKLVITPPHSPSAVAVSLRPRARPFLSASRPPRVQLEHRQFTRAVAALCGNNFSDIYSCEIASERLTRLTEGCWNVQIFLVPVSPQTEVSKGWFRWSFQRPRSPNLLLFTRGVTGQLRERFVPEYPSVHEVEDALGCV